MKTWIIIVFIVLALSLLMAAFLVLFLYRKRQAHKIKKNESKIINKRIDAEKMTLENHFFNISMEG